MATMRCHYEVFELPRDASTEEIKKQYRRLALKWHPDKNVGREEDATVKFKEINAAYAVLSDSNERKWYDDHRDSILRGGTGGTSDADVADPGISYILLVNSSFQSSNNFFLNHQGRPSICGNTSLQLAITEPTTQQRASIRCIMMSSRECTEQKPMVRISPHSHSHTQASSSVKRFFNH